MSPPTRAQSSSTFSLEKPSRLPGLSLRGFPRPRPVHQDRPPGVSSSPAPTPSPRPPHSVPPPPSPLELPRDPPPIESWPHPCSPESTLAPYTLTQALSIHPKPGSPLCLCSAWLALPAPGPSSLILKTPWRHHLLREALLPNPSPDSSSGPGSASPCSLLLGEAGGWLGWPWGRSVSRGEVQSVC